MPSASMVERWLDSGIVSFSSTLSAPLISESMSTSSSSASVCGVAGMATYAAWVPIITLG